MTRAEFLRELERALEREPNSLSEDARLADIDWDSLSELSFVACADRHLGLRLSAQAVNECREMAELLELVKPALSE